MNNPRTIDVAPYTLENGIAMHRKYIGGIVQRFLDIDLARDKLKKELLLQKEIGHCSSAKENFVTGIVIGRSTSNSSFIGMDSADSADHYDGETKENKKSTAIELVSYNK